jgi:hypothetical protein
MGGADDPTESSSQQLTGALVSALRKEWSDSVRPTSENFDAPRFVESRILGSQNEFKSESDWLNRWVLLFDHMIAYHYLAFSCYSRAIELRPSVRVLCFYSIYSAIFDDLYAIRILITHGRELAARKILRSVAEYFDVLLLLYFDSSLAPAYFSAQDSESANRFWHSTLAKGKPRKQIEKALADSDSMLLYRLLRDRNEEELSMLSQLVHPSYASSLFTFLPPADIALEEAHFEFSYALDFSVRTIKHVLTLTLAAVVLLEQLPLCSDQALGDELLNYDTKSELHQATTLAKTLMFKYLKMVLVETDEFFIVDNST